MNAPVGTRPKVLFLEDSAEDGREVMAFFTRQFPDLEFVWVKTTHAAREALEEQAFCAVISDNNCPVRESEQARPDQGIYIFDELRHELFEPANAANTPFLLQSSECNDALIEKARAQGCDAVIDKKDYKGYIEFMQKHKLIKAAPDADKSQGRI